ncbi:hypothetical protein O7635_19245 [Asanoa sp. WMMD1127]|uniref:hypothetical protein n=1 Tax=Asanoa sp. WMMD1127 TaxID=3016107 RepID=UPI002417EC45|nr:hypothetical protein [Asanoa sp. WMMD1127]MDG4823996.1 hypothetical protein [Asanoa sp. WMMD1127]
MSSIATPASAPATEPVAAAAATTQPTADEPATVEQRAAVDQPDAVTSSRPPPAFATTRPGRTRSRTSRSPHPAPHRTTTTPPPAEHLFALVVPSIAYR